jgi:hypothetical protein
MTPDARNNGNLIDVDILVFDGSQHALKNGPISAPCAKHRGHPVFS